MSDKRAKFYVDVLVRDKWCRSGNCPLTYESKESADRDIKQRGIRYMKYRVRRVPERRTAQEKEQP